MTGRALLAALAPALSLAGCFGSNDDPFQGYVEGVYVYVAAESMGRVVERPVAAGQRVQEGDILFRLDSDNQVEAIAAAEARLAQAEAQLANITTGQRPEEIAVIAAELASARTSFANADEDYSRKLVLRERGFAAQSVVDAAKTARDTAESRVEQIQRQLEVAKLPARPEEIDAAERNVAAEKAALAQARIQLERRTIRAPAAGLIEQTYFETGELVSAGQAVVSLLPDANKKVRFFLPERQLESVAPGSRIAVDCDGCPDGLTAEVDFVATEAEYTPPVIYSKEARDKLVYRIEAKPLGGAVRLNVGQPVDVRLLREPES